MKKITARSLACLFLSFILIAGTVIFTLRFLAKGGDWAAFPSNRHLYTNGILNCGRVLDKNGKVLAEYNDDSKWTYSSSSVMRRATLHAVGDPQGLIGTGALSRFADKLTGYNIVTGANTIIPGGRDVYLTIDADLCATAYEALNGHNGMVGVYNYKTGEIICMVSSPTYDLNENIDPEDKANDGVFINRLTSAKFIPGSTFKIITATAALEKIPDIHTRTFNCTGSTDIDGSKITCPGVHGTMNFEEALNHSCNCVFGTLAVEMGAGVLSNYADSTGLTDSYSINGINTMKSSFDFEGDGAIDLAWSGVGQGRDLVNPCSMMIFCGAVAGEGSAAVPQILSYTAFREGVRNSLYIKHFTGDLIKSSTAKELKNMMRTDVINNYGQKNFPGLEICAKSGTAQTDHSDADNAWFVGFLDDEDHPFAFVVMVEEGGSGARTAGRVANTVLQQAVKS